MEVVFGLIKDIHPVPDVEWCKKNEELFPRTGTVYVVFADGSVGIYPRSEVDRYSAYDVIKSIPCPLEGEVREWLWTNNKDQLLRLSDTEWKMVIGPKIVASSELDALMQAVDIVRGK